MLYDSCASTVRQSTEELVVVAGKIQRGDYGLWFRLKGPKGPIRTEHWYQNRSDRERALASLKGAYGDKFLDSGRLGKR